MARKKKPKPFDRGWNAAIDKACRKIASLKRRWPKNKGNEAEVVWAAAEMGRTAALVAVEKLAR